MVLLPAGSCLTGLGYVQGTLCAILVDDYLTKGGSITQLGSGKATSHV